MSKAQGKRRGVPGREWDLPSPVWRENGHLASRCMECGGKRSATPLWLNPGAHCNHPQVRFVTRIRRSHPAGMITRETNLKIYRRVAKDAK